MKNLLLLLLFIILTLNAYSKKVVTLGLTSTEISVQFLGEGELVACDTWSKGIKSTLGAVDLGHIKELKFELIKTLFANYCRKKKELKLAKRVKHIFLSLCMNT